MSEPTLEDIVAMTGGALSGWHISNAVLAREIIALRDGPTHVQLQYLDDRITALATRVQSLESEILHCVRTDYVDGVAREVVALRNSNSALASQVDFLNEQVGTLRESTQVSREIDLHALATVGGRVTTLESQARPFQESGELAVGREEESEDDDGEVKTPPILILLATEQSRDRALRHLKRAEAERDAAIARADEAENKMGVVRAWIRHLPNCAYGAYGMQIQSRPGTAHTRRCTCGLTDALDGSGRHEN